MFSAALSDFTHISIQFNDVQSPYLPLFADNRMSARHFVPRHSGLLLIPRTLEKRSHRGVSCSKYCRMQYSYLPGTRRALSYKAFLDLFMLCLVTTIGMAMGKCWKDRSRLWVQRVYIMHCVVTNHSSRLARCAGVECCKGHLLMFSLCKGGASKNGRGLIPDIGHSG